MIIILILFIPLPFWYGIRLFDRLHYEIIKHFCMLGVMSINTKQCSENLLLFDDIMKRHGIEYWLSEGTALGVVRDGAFIPWDDDVDVGMFIQHKKVFIDIVIPELKRNGFKIVNNFINMFSIVRKREKIDIDIVQTGKFCVSCKTAHAKCNTCSDMIPFLNGNLRQVDFLGRQFTVPGNSYLEYLYGPNWRTPIKQSTFEKFKYGF